ncbi:MAG: histidine kinase dimerization/phospho-acceptor domain-containing protein [Anaerolineae bacterium]
MSDVEKPQWLQRYDDTEWTMQAVQRYFYDMGHEIRTPLTALSLETEIIKRWLVQAKQGEMSFEKLDEIVQRLSVSTQEIISTFNTLTGYAVQRSSDMLNPQNPVE